MKDTTVSRVIKTAVTVRGKTYPRYLVIYRDDQGTRKRKAFSTLAAGRRFAEQCDTDAVTRAERQEVLTKKIGEDAAKLSAPHLRDALAALAILAGRATLETAAKAYCVELDRRQKEMPVVSELVTQHLAEAAARELRPRSIGDLRHRLGKITERFGTRRADEITRGDLREWLAGMKGADGKALSELSRRHFRGAAYALFAGLVGDERLEANPADLGRTRHNGDTTLPAIFTPEQIAALLTNAAKLHPDMVAPLALQAFAGLRTAEVSRITWERHIDLGRGLVMVTADVAKKRSVRNIAMPSNLAAWLGKGGTGPVVPRGWRTKLDAIAKEAGVTEWPQNGLRHSFGSYHLEAHGNTMATAAMMGHRDSGAMLFDHYRQLVRPEAAAAYWKIVPAKENTP